eukprot:scaffold52808_cov49-Cyclotella_meneghiniana.AAC.7
MLLRSGEDPINILEPEACEMETSSIRRFVRLPTVRLDIITAEVGSKFKLYVSNSAYENEYGWWKDKLRYVIDTLNVNTTRMNATDFYVLDVHIHHATLHT